MAEAVRHRTFCRYCGAMTPNLDSVCAAHRDLIRAERDLIPPDPLTTIPRMQAAPPSEDMQTAEGTEA